MKYVDVDGVGRLSRIGLGTWQFGSREWGYGDSYAAGAAGDIVRRALALGVTLFDTAEIYGFGKSERILGDALGEQRAEVAVASKIMPVAPSPRWSGNARGPAPGGSDWTASRSTRCTSPTRCSPIR